MTIEQELRNLIKYLDEHDQPYEEIYDQIIKLVNKRVGELVSEIDRLKKQDVDVIISYAIERQKLIEGLLQIGHDHGLKHTVNGILKEAEVEERVDYGVLE